MLPLKLAEGFELAGEGQPWWGVDVVASDTRLPGLEALEGEALCEPHTSGDHCSMESCSALKGISSVG